MEDVTRALMIAGGVFIGIMIVTVGMVLFSSLGQYTDDTQKQIEENAVQSFNEQFTKYINYEDGSSTVEFDITIQDVITVANLAYENNKNYGLEDKDDYNYYVSVHISGVENNLEKNISNKTAELLKNKGGKKLYKCTANNVKINPNTDRVCEIIFQEYDM